MPEKKNTRFCQGLQTRFSLALRHLPKDTPLLVGLSGGRDSVVLLDLLLTTGHTSLIVCHLHHGLRGTAADEDARFCEEVALKSNLRFINDKIAVRVTKKGSWEAAAREARQAFFGRVALEAGVSDLVLGHHADDQAETFLWNLLRGGGSSGLDAMSPVSEWANALRVHRPMLDLWRTEIDRYTAERRLIWREDATNASPQFTRNRLRHEIIPWLEEKLGRNIRQPIWRTAEILRAENAWLATLDGPLPAPGPLSIAEFAGQPLAWQRRRVRAWLEVQRVAECGFEEIEAVLSLLDLANGPARINLPGNLQARRRAGRISLVQLAPPHR